MSSSNPPIDIGLCYKPSSESFSHFKQASSTVAENSNAETSIDNNNLLNAIDHVELLNLKSDDNEDQYSNSSSLESRNSLTNHQGSQNGDGESGSTSCSEDSFEMSSTCSAREESFEGMKNKTKKMQEGNIISAEKYEAHPRRSDFSEAVIYGSHLNGLNRISSDNHLNLQNEHLQQIRRTVADQIQHIDTGLPQLDFVKLEKQLTTAAKEREDIEKRIAENQMAEQDKEDQNWRKFTAFQPYKKPNSVLRLPPSKNLQVCFMNELSETDTNGEDSEDSDMEHSYVRKSKSVPNFKNATHPDVLDPKVLKELIDKLEKDMTLTESKLQSISIRKRVRKILIDERCTMLKHEAYRVLKIAEEKAKVSLADYRRGKSKASEVPRQARQYLSKTKLRDIQIIHRQIEEAINRKNNELVGLLLERDNLHMEYDSLRVDIDDYTQQKSPLIFLDMKRLLHLQNGLEQTSLQTKRAI
ncbi:hypothetical protein CAEBREN_28356 [Caenorhabditis brenneri]|uniref:Schwannomin interacting protein 1 C-terminal domain-containing protein n=1 Tax=Caenorhabditis brenneri TaxID=135651 RepID=G0N7M7_CAEBE|nr:hypothetical protein CAEBREN_28356 [Caenorhabditis brenneri]